MNEPQDIEIKALGIDPIIASFPHPRISVRPSISSALCCIMVQTFSCRGL